MACTVANMDRETGEMERRRNTVSSNNRLDLPLSLSGYGSYVTCVVDSYGIQPKA